MTALLRVAVTLAAQIAMATLIAPVATSRAATPELARERIVFHTTGGDLVFALYPKLAPKTVAQILRLARLGIYDTTYFYRLEKGFVLQIANAQDRTRPMTAEQTAALQKIPAEFSAHLHRRGVLSMARWDNDVNSAETSFSILLGDAPHLDGKYTVFGTVESGWDVLQLLESVPTDDKHRPKARIEILGTEVLTEPALRKLSLRGPQGLLLSMANATVAATDSSKANDRHDLQSGLIFVLLSIVGVGLCATAFSSKLGTGQQRSLILVMVLLGGFALLMVLTPVGQKDARIAPFVFLGLLGLFRLMGQFEASR